MSTTYYRDGNTYTLIDIKALHKNVSFNNNTPYDLGYEVILPTPKPTTTELQQVVSNGTTVDTLGNRVEAWLVQDMFSDILAEDGITVITKLEQETTHLATTLKVAKENKLRELARKSSEVEEGGILVGTLEVNTDRNTQALLNGAFAHASRNPNQTFSFKGKSQWAIVDKATIDAVNDAVGNHVRATFDNEKVHRDAIDLLTTPTEVQDYDISIGW